MTNDVKQERKVKIYEEDESLNIDRVLDLVLEKIDKQAEFDTEIKIDLAEETIE